MITPIQITNSAPDADNLKKYFPRPRPHLTDEVSECFSLLESLFRGIKKAKAKNENEVIVSLASLCGECVESAKENALKAINHTILRNDGVLVVDYSKTHKKKEVIV